MGGADIDQIAVYAIGAVGAGKGLSHPRNDIVRREYIIGMQQADDVAVRARDPFIDAIIEAAVARAFNPHLGRGAALEHGNGAVCRSTVLHDVLDMLISLGANAADRVGDRCRAIVYGRDD